MIKIEISREKMPRVTFTNEDGANRTVHLYHDQVVNMILESSRSEVVSTHSSEEISLSSPSLPIGTVKYSQGAKGSHFLFLVEPEKRSDVKYNEFSFEQVPFPKLVFAFKVHSQSLIQTYVAAYKDINLRDSTELYRFPYSNVYTDGQLCYWSNESVVDLVQLHTFPAQWKAVPSNDHIYFFNSTNKASKTLYDLFHSLQNKAFNYDILQPMDITFGDWSSSFLKK